MVIANKSQARLRLYDTAVMQASTAALHCLMHLATRENFSCPESGALCTTWLQDTHTGIKPGISHVCQTRILFDVHKDETMK